jgi:predicted lipoprotein with Yx(FWY)xxD motif
MRRTWTAGMLLAVGVIAGACGSSGAATSPAISPSTSPATAPTTASPPTTTLPAPTTTSTTTTSAPVVTVATDPKLGQLLVGPNGHTVYLFEDDKGTTSACTGACATVWPALTSSTAPFGGAGTDQTKLGTAIGQKPDQVVYNRHFLYYFSGDSQPGQVNGITIPHWDAIAPTGAKVDGGN